MICKSRLLSTIAFLLTVCLRIGQSCDVTLAAACLDPLVPLPDSPTKEQCTASLDSLEGVEDCITPHLEGCSETDRVTTRATLNALQNKLNAADICGGGDSCPSIATNYPNFKKCIKNVNFNNLTDEVSIKWNNDLYNSLKPSEPLCLALHSVIACIRAETFECAEVRWMFGLLFVEEYPSLRAVLEICGLEVQANRQNSGPLITECTTDVETVLTEIQTDCVLDANYKDETLDMLQICASMQRQITCVLSYQQDCPLAVTAFLRPRVSSYALANLKFCQNMTINSIRVKPIPGFGCNYENTYACFHTIMRSFGAKFGYISQDSVKQLLQWNVYDDQSICLAMRDYNSSSTQICVRNSLNNCIVPFPTFLPYYIASNDRDVYNHSMYENLVGGPTGFNEFGAKLIGDRRGYICFNCSYYDEYLSEMDTTCASSVNTAAINVKNAETPETKNTTCEAFEDTFDCFSSITLSCPLLQNRAQVILGADTITDAMTICKLDDPELLPPNYLPTTWVPPPATTPVKYNTTTRMTFSTSTFRTTTRSSSSASTTSSQEPTVGSSTGGAGAAGFSIIAVLSLLVCAVFL